MLDKLIRLTLYLFLFLLPLYFIPFHAGAEFDKNALLIFATAALFFLALFKVFSKGQTITLFRTPIDLLLIALCFIFLLSAFISSPNYITSFTQPMSVGTVIAATVLFFLLTNIIPSPSFTPLLFSSSLAALYTLLKQTKILPVLADSLPLGNTLTTFIFLIPLSVYLISDIILNHRKKDRYFLAKLVLLLPLTSTSIYSAFLLFTSQKPLLLPFIFAWTIMLEMFKNLTYFFLGVGPTNYQFAFSLAKPAIVNNTPFWTASVSSASNSWFTITTEAGILAGAIWLLIFIKSAALLFKDIHSVAKPYVFAAITAFLLQLLLPSNTALFVLTFILLAFSFPKTKEKKLVLSPRLLPLTLPLYIFPLAVVFLGAKAYLANFYYQEAVYKINNQNLNDAFNLTQRAIELNSNVDSYYQLSSELSLNFAFNLSQTKEATLSASQQVISQLNQQAISHAQRASQLNRLNSRNWAQLSRVYQNLADSPDLQQLTLDAYNQQILLEPTSPLPLVEAANFLLSLGNSRQAQNLLERAIALKPDWNRPYYLMSQILINNKDYQQAERYLQQTLNLSPAESEDYSLISEQLKMVGNLKEKQATPSANK